MSHEQLLSSPARTDLGLVKDLFDATMLRLKTSMVKRCGGDVPLRPELPVVRPLEELLQPIDDYAIGAATPFTLTPGSLRGLVILDVPLVQRLVGLFLGEDPEITGPMALRRLTRLDLQMARWICEDVVEAMLGACSMADVPQGQVGAPQSNPRSVRGLPQSPSVIEVEIELGPEDMPYGRATVVLPAQAAGVLWPERRNPPAPRVSSPAQAVARVKNLSVPVVVELARRRLPMSKLQQMQPGDLLELGGLREATLQVGGKPLLLGEPGEQDGSRSIRIIRRIGPQGGRGTDR
ncbi:MAG TPA: flagellar motor switch protein FliM [Deltaproteobacteria bacterium]|nr:flagellar motor switch protein FliM [Deltaproteobacteria bacterium]